MSILHQEPFYIYMVNMIAEPVNLLKFMIFAYASSASTCILYARGGVPNRLRDRSSILTRLDKLDSDLPIDAVRYEPAGPCDDTVDLQKAENNQEKFCKPIGTNTLPHRTSSPHIATNSLTCLYRLKARGKDTLIRLKSCSIESNLRTWIFNQFPQTHITKGLRQEN